MLPKISVSSEALSIRVSALRKPLEYRSTPFAVPHLFSSFASISAQMPISGYMAFTKATQPALLQQGLKLVEASKSIGEKWRALSDSEKAHWSAEAVKLQAEREAKIASGEIKLKEKRKSKDAKKEKPASKRLKGLTSPYFLFMKERRPAIVAANPDAAVTKIVQLLAEEWKSVSVESRDKYKAAADAHNAEIKKAAGKSV